MAERLVSFASWFCTSLVLVGLLLPSCSCREVRGKQLITRACHEIYVVGDGETLHTISDKCDDPFILDHNPHIHDPDDVFPGLIIKITPFSTSTK